MISLLSGDSKRLINTTNAQEDLNMPLYMDIHNLPGVKAGAVAEAHQRDLEEQDKYGVKYLKYWVDEEQGKVFCLVDAPNADAANDCHREAHGLVADEIHEVTEHS